MMLPASERRRDLRKVLENERKAYLERFPQNGHPVTVLPMGRAECAAFETQGFNGKMQGRRGRYAKAYSGGVE